MVNYPSRPQFQIITNYGGSSYTHTNDQFTNGKIVRLENGFDTAVLYCNDFESKNFLAKVDSGQDITIKFKDASDASWTTVLDGVVRFINMPFSKGGEILELKCDGAGYGFAETACGEEYGTESSNSSLDTLKEIITDSTYGIVPKWVNSILGSASSSGYSYSMTRSVANDLIENIAGSIKYLYFPYKPSSKALQDLCDVVQGIKGASAGPHWIVTTNEKLIVSTIGNHDATAVAEGWTNYYGGSQADATLEQGTDFIEYYFQKLVKEANYVLYQGAVHKPIDRDSWTENNAASWGSNAYANVADDASGHVGAAIQVTTTGTGGVYRTCWAYYPSGINLNFNVEAMGGKYILPVIHFWVKVDQAAYTANDQLKFRFFTTNTNNRFVCSGTVQEIVPNHSVWVEEVLPIGPYAEEGELAKYVAGPSWWDGWGTFGSPDWADIDAFSVGFWTDTDGLDVWIDNLYIAGTVLRGAYESGIGANNKLKVKVITDDVAKDDSIVASDDTGTIARLAYAELLRCKTTPIVGFVQTPLISDIWPGMLVHIHAKKKADGSFNINSDFRVVRLEHTFATKPQGYRTKLFLTNDVTNSNARSAFNDVNRMMAAVRPEFQDRQASSIKARMIDVGQPILAKSY